MNPTLSYSVRELHIDLLFLEEFYSSGDFRKWFIALTIGFGSTSPRLIAAKHSVLELERESDLEIVFQRPDGDIFFLIENKINARFQPDQALDYKKRGMDYERRGLCIKSYTVLLAPQTYINTVKSTHIFDYYLSFEQVIEYFNSQELMGERAHYKIEVLRKAISKFNSASTFYEPSEINEGISLFWKNYWEDISVRLPEVHMPRPGVKGPAATFIGLAKSSLPVNVFIYHKFARGFVDLQFEGLGSKIDSFIHTFQEHLEESMQIQKAGKSVVVRIQVHNINPHMNYETLQADVHTAQNSADILLNWFLRHSGKWTEFKTK